RLEAEPNNPEPYYWIGVIDWGLCYPRTMKVRQDLKLDQPGSDGDLTPLPEEARTQLADDNGPLVDEGLDALQKALELKPDFFDTLSYLNLLYRQKAEIEATAEARAEDLRRADAYVQRALDVRKKPAERHEQSATPHP